MVLKNRVLPFLILSLIFLIKCKDSPTQATNTAPQNIEKNQRAEVGTPGSAPEQLAPSDTVKNVARNPQFKWQAVDGADEYLLDASDKEKMIIHKRVDTTIFTSDETFSAKKTYYWRVRAIHNGTKGKWSEIHSFTTGDSIRTQLSAPEQAAPTDKKEAVARNPQFKWQAVDGADEYLLDASDKKKMIIHQRIDATSFTPDEAFSANKTYYWRVRAIHNGTKGKWSEVHSFTTGEKERNTVSTELKAPKDNAEDRPVNTELQWKKVSDASKYKIELAHGEQFKSLLVDKSVEATSYKVSDLKHQQNYTWRVKPIVPDKESEWSETWHFKTSAKSDPASPEKLSAPEQAAPTDKKEGVARPPKFKWKEVNGADEYLLDASDKKKVIIHQRVDATSFTPDEAFSAKKTYYWRVRAVREGTNGKWSEIHSFTTAAEATGGGGNSAPVVSLLSPDDGASDQPVSMSLRWESLPGINQYQVQVAPGSGFSRPVTDEATGSNTYKLSGLDNDQTYYWRVQATGDGNSSNWSTVRSFHTVAASDNGGKIASSDRQALMDLYNATGGDQWKNNSGWGSSAPLNSWHGIKTNSQGRVVRLNLYGNNLTGNLPETIGNLTKVEYFNVKQNNISGNIPSSIGNMQSLVYLLLNGVSHDPDYYGYHPSKPYDHSLRINSFTGALPSSIGNLSNLEWLEIAGDGGRDTYGGDYVLHTGITSLPSSLGNLTQLKGLILSFAPISSLPNLGGLTKMEILSLEGCIGLQGQPLPTWITNMTNLGSLWAEDVGFTGTFPDISSATGLNFLMFAENDFTGDFPTYAIDGTMPDINMVSFAYNDMTGTLPKFGSDVNLTMFDVVSNRLTGTVPSNLDTQTRMINLGLGWNNFSGDFPSDLSGLHQLRFIYANDNNFTGTLPLIDTSNNALNFLWFQNNQMSGKVPASLAGIANLPRIDSGDLKIGNNNFSQSDIQDLINALKAKGKLNILNH